MARLTKTSGLPDSTGRFSGSSPAQGTGVMTDSKQDWKAKKEEQARLRKKQNELKKTEEEIASLEERDSALDEQLMRPEVASDVAKLMEIHKEQEAVKQRLEELYAVWEELAEEV